MAKLEGRVTLGKRCMSDGSYAITCGDFLAAADFLGRGLLNLPLRACLAAFTLAGSLLDWFKVHASPPFLLLTPAPFAPPAWAKIGSDQQQYRYSFHC